MLRRDLVGRDAEVRLRPALRHRAGQEHGRGARVVRARRDVGAAGPGDVRMREAADDVDAIAERLERLQDLGEREAGPLRGRRPLVHRRAVRHVERDEPRLRRCRALPQRRLRADHRVEQRQRDGGADAPQERPPREVLFGDEHRHCSGCC